MRKFPKKLLLQILSKNVINIIKRVRFRLNLLRGQMKQIFWDINILNISINNLKERGEKMEENKGENNVQNSTQNSTQHGSTSKTLGLAILGVIILIGVVIIAILLLKNNNTKLVSEDESGLALKNDSTSETAKSGLSINLDENSLSITTGDASLNLGDGSISAQTGDASVNLNDGSMSATTGDTSVNVNITGDSVSAQTGDTSVNVSGSSPSTTGNTSTNSTEPDASSNQLVLSEGSNCVVVTNGTEISIVNNSNNIQVYPTYYSVVEGNNITPRYDLNNTIGIDGNSLVLNGQKVLVIGSTVANVYNAVRSILGY